MQKPDAFTQQRANELKQEVKTLLINVNDHLQELNLIDAIQRLGVGYHFETEIADALLRIYNASIAGKDDTDDLHMVALQFRLLRQEGYNVSPSKYLALNIFHQYSTFSTAIPSFCFFTKFWFVK